MWTTLGGTVHNGGGYACVGAKGIWEISVPSRQFGRESKTALKNQALPFCSHRWSTSGENELQSLCDFWPEQEPQKAFQCTFPHSQEDISLPLSKELRQKCNVRSMPIRKDDEVQVVRGRYKGQQTGKGVQVYRQKYVIYTEWGQWEKANDNCSWGHSPQQGSEFITRLKLDKDHNKVLEWKAKSRQVGKEKGKSLCLNNWEDAGIK